MNQEEKDFKKISKLMVDKSLREKHGITRAVMASLMREYVEKYYSNTRKSPISPIKDDLEEAIDLFNQEVFK